ncbi:MAG: aspartate kinase [Flavobacteriales bacterium]|nr:MAG: aspartate kinase [Flavobacteriales bacterium]
MKVFKFGGASVKDAAGVRNVARVLTHFPGEDILVVLSAMGKTTNALERVVWDWRDGKSVRDQVEVLRQQHVSVLHEVVPGFDEAEAWLLESFDELEELLSGTPTDRPDQDYDQIVSYGELWSTQIVSAYLSEELEVCSWMDARDLVRTDALHRSARVDWETSAQLVKEQFSSGDGQEPVQFPVITQGFIGATDGGLTTTLGREGSDFSAAIFAYLLDAESVTIWKDVPGMFNADPKRFPDTKLLSHISYREAIELSYFGASVIHPRTLQPLQQKHIPLYVRSFMDLAAPGSIINDVSESDSLIPSFIVKPKQLLVSITPRDLSFVVEENLHHIFGLFARANVRIDLMQNSALAFSVVVDDTPRSRSLIEELRRDYEVRYNEECELVTVRHYDDATLERLCEGREVLIEQRSRTTARFVLK